MIDFLLGARQALIENFQISVRAIRLLMGYSIIEMAEYVGVTRQTINNLETGKSKMSVMQFLSLAAVVDNYIAMNGDMYQAIEAILDGNGKKAGAYYDTSFSGYSLLRRWFLLFSGTEAEISSDDGRALDPSQILQMVRGYKIFLDDTVLLMERSEEFLRPLVNTLLSENGKLIIPLRSIERIQEWTRDVKLSQQAIKALRLLTWLQQNDLVQIRGEKSDADLHDTILSVFLRFRGTYRLCLITQDEQFANEVLRLNERNDKRGFSIAVGYINDDGQLVMYGAKNEDPALSEPFGSSDRSESEQYEHEQNEHLQIKEDKLIDWKSL